MKKVNQRQSMVENQLASRGLTNSRLLAAFLKVPREKFFLRELLEFAYADGPFPIGEEQTISQPYIVALMTEYLELKGSEKVLEIGTGSGYQTAILAELAAEIYTVERIRSLSERAQKTLGELGYKNIRFLVGDGTAGWAEAAPFDRIIVTAAARAVPSPLTTQLAEDGIMEIPIGERGFQVLNIIRKKNSRLVVESRDGCVFVPLVGEYEIQGGSALF
jgi:protein-L-isoaspartate(D-aspartate) O-methyltransferase